MHRLLAFVGIVLMLAGLCTASFGLLWLLGHAAKTSLATALLCHVILDAEALLIIVTAVACNGMWSVSKKTR